MSFTELLDLVYVLGSTAKGGEASGAQGRAEGWGVCSWLGAPIHTTYGKFYTPFSSPDRGSQGGIQFLNNAVNAEFCEPISQAGRPRPFLSF